MNEVDGHLGELRTALNDMRRAFERTHDYWRDSSREEFYKLYIEPIENELDQAAKAIAQTASILSQVHTDCK